MRWLGGVTSCPVEYSNGTVEYGTAVVVASGNGMVEYGTAMIAATGNGIVKQSIALRSYGMPTCCVSLPGNGEVACRDVMHRK